MIERTTERGAALIVALVLLVVLTLLATTAMTTAIVELVIADNARFRRQAFEAAESGIAAAIAHHARIDHEAAGAEPVPAEGFSAVREDGSEVEVSVFFRALTPVPDAAFSMGAGLAMPEAHHFEIVAVGRAARGAVARHRQGFYIVAPRKRR